jgi:hypothetical protein
MKITMLVSISRSDGFRATTGEVVEVDDAMAQDLLTNEMAIPTDAIKLPRQPVVKPTATKEGKHGNG